MKTASGVVEKRVVRVMKFLLIMAWSKRVAVEPQKLKEIMLVLRTTKARPRIMRAIHLGRATAWKEPDFLGAMLEGSVLPQLSGVRVVTAEVLKATEGKDHVVSTAVSDGAFRVI